MEASGNTDQDHDRRRSREATFAARRMQDLLLPYSLELAVCDMPSMRFPLSQ